MNSLRTPSAAHARTRRNSTTSAPGAAMSLLISRNQRERAAAKSGLPRPGSPPPSMPCCAGKRGRESKTGGGEAAPSK